MRSFGRSKRLPTKNDLGHGVTGRGTDDVPDPQRSFHGLDSPETATGIPKTSEPLSDSLISIKYISQSPF
jgi:hypothetical protein